MAARRKAPRSGGPLAALIAGSLLCACLFAGIVPPELPNPLRGAMVTLGLIFEPIGGSLLRLFKPLVFHADGSGPWLALRPLDPGERALLGALLPFALGLLWMRRAVRWRLAVLRSDLGVSGAAQAARAPESGATVARRWLAARGIEAGPDQPAPSRAPEPDFAEAEAAARAMLKSLRDPSRDGPQGR